MVAQSQSSKACRICPKSKGDSRDSNQGWVPIQVPGKGPEVLQPDQLSVAVIERHVDSAWYDELPELEGVAAAEGPTPMAPNRAARNSAHAAINACIRVPVQVGRGAVSFQRKGVEANLVKKNGVREGV